VQRSAVVRWADFLLFFYLFQTVNNKQNAVVKYF